MCNWGVVDHFLYGGRGQRDRGRKRHTDSVLSYRDHRNDKKDNILTDNI